MPEFSYSTDVDDYVAFSLHQFAKSRDSRLARRFIQAVLCIGAATAAITFVVRGFDAAGVVSGVVGVVFWFGYPPASRALTAWNLRSYASRLDLTGIVGPIRLVMDEQTLVELTTKTRTESAWKGMAGVEEVGERTFILVTPTSAAILPRRGFDDPEDYRRARDYAVARVGPAGRMGPDLANDF